MPIYEYKCPEGHIVERMSKVKDRTPTTECVCGQEATKIISRLWTHTWRPLQLELESNKPRVFESKKDLKAECERLGKAMPGHDIY